MWLIIASLIGTATFLFIFWKKLKEDYLPDQIFMIAFYVIVGIVLGYFLSTKVLTSWWFWIEVIFSLLGLTAGLVRYKFRFYESFEAYVVGLLPWFSLVLFADSVLNANLSSFIAFSFIIVLIGLYYFLDTHYKNFSWYASGRVGFAGLVTAGIFFLVRATLALFSIPVLSLAGRLDSIFSGLVGFLMFFLVYNLARS